MSETAEKPIRLLVSDVDGTLVRKDKSLADATIAAARKLEAAGIAMTLISARPPSGILPLAKAMGLTAELGAFNGGTVFLPDGTIVSAHRLDAADSEKAIALFAAAKVSVWAFADGQWFASDDTNPHNDHERRASMVEPEITTDFSGLHGRIDKVVGVSDDHDLVKRLEAQAKAAIGPSATISRSQDYYCDVTHALANKGAGIEALSRSIGVPLDECAAIGDMPNDIPMLERAALGIAMGQAPVEVKTAARWVTASNEEDGVAKAIERVLIPEVRRHRL